MGETKYNEDELRPHSWLDEDFFRNVLVKCENDNSVKITNLTITPGSDMGDHYASVMFRVKVTYDDAQSKGNSKSMIIKTAPEAEGLKKEMLQESSVFETEISMYSETIPKLEAELRKIGDNTVLAPKALYHSLGERKFIIFEDLVSKGYDTIKKRLPNISETKATLLKLAKWHAVSYKLNAEGDTAISNYRDNMFNSKGFIETPFATRGIDLFIKLAEGDDELKKYVPKLNSIKQCLLQNTINSTNSYRDHEKAQGVFTLCHGDFHSKNAMFKWDEKGELDDVLLLDLQLCYYGPAVLDIVYAKYMMLSDEIRETHYEELVYFYSSNFIDTLRKLNFKGHIPKIADFHMDLLRHRHVDLYMVVTYLPLTAAFISGDFDPEEIISSEEARSKFYQSPLYKKEVKRLLPILLHRGYLE